MNYTANPTQKPVNSMKLIQRDLFLTIGNPHKPGKHIYDQPKRESFVFLDFPQFSIRLYDRYATVLFKRSKKVIRYERRNFNKLLHVLTPVKNPMSMFNKPV
jgi:hypothetical protein